MSQEESAPVENVEAGKQAPVAEPDEEITFVETVEPWGTTSVLQFAMAIISVPFLILSAVYMKYASESEERNDMFYNGAVAGICMFIFLTFAYYSCSNARMGFNPSLIWGAAGARNVYGGTYYRRRRRTDSRDNRGSSSRQDVESQSSANANAQQVDASSSDPCTSTVSDEREMLLQTSVTKQVCQVKKISEVASTVSKVTLETVAEKGESMESLSASIDEQHAHTESVQAKEAKTDSDSELMSSGELRRRKMENPEECKDSSNSSDEDPPKKE